MSIAPCSDDPLPASPLVSISIAPHCSLSGAQALGFFLSIAFVCLGVGMVMALRGFWPVLPFAGAELALLGWALRRSLARRHHIEVITLTDTQVILERLGGKRPERFEFSRHWAQVKLRRSDSHWRPARLCLESHGRGCEIGSFLTEAERHGLARRLRNLVGRVAETPPLAAPPAEDA